MSAAGKKEGQRLLNTGSDAYGTSFGPINAAYWKVSHCPEHSPAPEPRSMEGTAVRGARKMAHPPGL